MFRPHSSCTAMPTRSGVLSLTPEDIGVEMEKLAEDINDKVSACLKTKDELHSELLCFVVVKAKYYLSMI